MEMKPQKVWKKISKLNKNLKNKKCFLSPLYLYFKLLTVVVLWLEPVNYMILENALQCTIWKKHALLKIVPFYGIEMAQELIWEEKQKFLTPEKNIFSPF